MEADYYSRFSADSQLRRSLDTRHGVALVVSNVIGAGIFTTPAIVAALVPSATAMLAIWAAGGILALCGAVSYAQLSRLSPNAGGEYAYLSRAFGPLAGFLSGWISLIAGFSGAIAASAVALVSYFAHFLPALASERVLASFSLHFLAVSITWRLVAAVAVIVFFGVLHSSGLTGGKITQTALAMGVLGMISAFIVTGFAFGSGSWDHMSLHAERYRGINLLLALVPIMFAYSGWNAAAYVSEEMRNERKTGRALLIGTVVVMVVYSALNVLFIYALPIRDLKANINVGDVAARALFGAAGSFLTAVMVLALLGAISAMTFSGPRVYFAMARDGVFIPSLARTSKKTGVPLLAIALQTLWSIALVVLGSFEQILMYTGFAIVLSSAVAVLGLFVIRGSVYKRGAFFSGTVAPLLFVLVSAAITISVVLKAPTTALAGVGLIAAGIPVFGWSRRNSTASKEMRLYPAESPELMECE